MTRRIAVNRVIIDGKEHLQCVVEIENGIVTSFREFTGELPFTEWRGGTIHLYRDKDNLLRIRNDAML